MLSAHDFNSIDVASCCGFREPFSSWSHLLGAIVFAALSYPLVQRGRGNGVRMGSLIIFAVSSIELLLMSGIYHLFWPGPARSFMLRVDVAGVFILIAASMTPVHAILFKGLARWGALALIWMVAISGIVWRTVMGIESPGTMGIVLFLLFGWGALVTTIALWRRFGWKFVRPAVWSGLAYTIGAICLVLGVPTIWPTVMGPHEVWHVAVLTGLGLQWYFISQFASGDLPRVELTPALLEEALT